MQLQQDEIIEMARQAEIEFNEEKIAETGFKYQGAMIAYEELEAFAKLVALRYEKKIADLENIICQRHWDVLQEREACAKLCEAEWTRFGYDADARDCAEEIRARGTEA